MIRLLVVDDDPQLLRALRINLRAHEYDVTTATSGTEAVRAASHLVPDLVILDLGLPDVDGVEVIHGIRGWSDMPILVLSGRTQGAEKVAALDAGADDFVSKPFGMEELLARIRAITRRSGAQDAAEAVATLGGTRVDLANRLVTDPFGQPVRLTPTEWGLLEALMRHPGKLMSQRQLLTQVWGSAYQNQASNLRLYMAQLRRKLEPDPQRPRYLLTEPGMGYRFQPEP